MESEPTPPLRHPRATSTRQTLSEGRQSEQSEACFTCSLPEEVKTSTWLSELRKADIKVPTVYILGSKIFQGSLITENMRARIRSFMISQASKQWVMRETLALACTYVDLYFKHQGFCPIEEFQNLAIAALILAMKNQEGKFPTVSFKVFPKEELLNWQKKLAKRLQYFLLPPTYVSIAEQLNIRWQDFTKGHPKYNSLVLDAGSGPNLRLRSLYEQLDCVFMVLKSLSWPLQTLVLNLFYLHVRAANVSCLLEPSQLGKQEFIKNYYARDAFRIFFQHFLQTFSQQIDLKLDEELGGYLKLFLALKPTLKEFQIKKSLDALRIWDKLQTFPNECYSLYKSIIEKLK